METHALKDINLTISAGDYMSISGPSGCGKLTLLSLIGLLDMPSSGEYIIGVQPGIPRNVSKIATGL